MSSMTSIANHAIIAVYTNLANTAKILTPVRQNKPITQKWTSQHPFLEQARSIGAQGAQHEKATRAKVPVWKIRKESFRQDYQMVPTTAISVTVTRAAVFGKIRCGWRRFGMLNARDISGKAVVSGARLEIERFRLSVDSRVPTRNTLRR